MRTTLGIFFGSEKRQFGFLGTGVRLGHTTPLRVLKARYGGAVQDYEAHAHAFCFKGASGSLPCIRCMNVVAGRDVSQQSLLHDVKTAKRTDCILRSRQNVYDSFDQLRHLASSGLSKKDFKAEEQARGMNYCPQSVYFAEELRAIVDPAEGMVIDWFHCLCSSGGMASYEANEFIRQILAFDERLTLTLMDKFKQDVTLPTKSGAHMPSFDHIYNQSDAAQLGVTGSMVYDVVQVLWIFAQTALIPEGISS